jgi:hypothetical protein
MCAHADVTGYAVDQWREQATLWAHVSAWDLERANANAERHG